MSLNEDIVRESYLSEAAVDKVAEHERRELLRREAVYRGGRPPPDLAGKRAVLVDDGLTTGGASRR